MVEKKDKEQGYHLVEVPTSFGIGIRTPEDEVLSQEQALVLLLNKLDKIEKALA